MIVDSHLCEGVIVLPPPCGHPDCLPHTTHPLVIDGVGFTHVDLN